MDSAEDSAKNLQPSDAKQMIATTAMASLLVWEVRMLTLFYAALSDARSSVSQGATMSDTAHSRAVTPAAIAGLVCSVRLVLMKLYAK